MQDMTMQSGKTTASIGQMPVLTPEQEVESRAKLIQALQMTLEPNEVLSIFFKHLQSIIPVGGIQFRFANSTGLDRLRFDVDHQPVFAELLYHQSSRRTV